MKAQPWHGLPALEPMLCSSEDLVEDSENARAHDKRSIETIASSLWRFGQTKPIVALEDGTVIAGNGTLRAARSLGWAQIAVVRFANRRLAKAYALADNRTAELSTWDPEALRRIADEVAGQDLALDSLGFEASELERLTAIPDPPIIVGAYSRSSSLNDSDVDRDDDFVAGDGPTLALGDQVLSPGAILSVGDCLDVMADLADESFDSVVTDPPYGIDIVGRLWDGSVPGPRWADECLRLLKPGRYLVAFAATRTVHRLATVLEDAGFEIRDQIAWLNWQGMPKGKGLLKPAFEPAVLARKKGKGPKLNIEACRYEDGDPAWPGRQGDWDVPNPRNPVLPGAKGLPTSGRGDSRSTMNEGGRWPANVYACSKPRRREKTEGAEENLHPTVKPVRLMRWLCRLVTPPGGLVLEPFAGSGTTAVAALREGLRVHAIEREAEYARIADARIRYAAGLKDWRPTRERG